MAKSNSFNKRELEKKKISKRLEKQQKKEDRKASGGSGSFEDMIAYVDENGVITDTPPDLLKKKEEIDIESIAISVPKKLETEEEDGPMNGKVDYFTSSKGYGFIKDARTGNKYFFHVSGMVDQVSEEDLVTFELERGAKGMNAINIKLLK